MTSIAIITGQLLQQTASIVDNITALTTTGLALCGHPDGPYYGSCPSISPSVWRVRPLNQKGAEKIPKIAVDVSQGLTGAPISDQTVRDQAWVN